MLFPRKFYEHDMNGLIDLAGGDHAFVAKLDSVFSVPNAFKVGTYNLQDETPGKGNT